MKTYTHKHQPSDSVLVYRIGQACYEAARGPAGDYIDTGLILLRMLEAQGFGITSLNPSLPERMSHSGIAEQPQAREVTDAEIDALRKDAERYRWLRQQHEESDSAESFCVFEPTPAHDLQPVGSMPGELDEAIDVAIALANGKG